MTIQPYFGLDFETYSDVDLKKHGLDRYVTDPSFRPMIAHTDIVGRSWDFVLDPHAEKDFVNFLNDSAAKERTFVAQNVGFERAVLKHYFKTRPELYEYAVDSAVIARTQGAGSSLEAAAPQLLGEDKLDTGSDLIKKFSVPNEWNNYSAPTAQLLLADAEALEKWKLFNSYCYKDAVLSAQFVETFFDPYSDPVSNWSEAKYERITAQMNEIGWRVDLDLVHEMRTLYETNLAEELERFYEQHDQKRTLNFNSAVQLKKWCADRGVRATSFDQEHLPKLITAVQNKITTLPSGPKLTDYMQVYDMLVTKRTLGGTALKKLYTILDMVGTDGRLRNQYLHCGAGQTYRTSGRGVQMQNLKRLSADLMDMDALLDGDYEDVPSNDDLGKNLRQVFTATTQQGKLVVGDFSSVESRGLAWLAGADWKIGAYRAGKDLYKVQASQIYGIPYADVDKAQRQTGKLGELSCGYGAGPVAVMKFAAKMGIEMIESEALQLVRDWRSTNPEAVELWDKIQTTLEMALRSKSKAVVYLANDLTLQFVPVTAPVSLEALHPGVQSLKMRLMHVNGTCILERMFQGAHFRGRDIVYYKPSQRKTGALWNSSYFDPKLKKTIQYTLYGGKLAGILTQSMCREMFFQSLQQLTYKIGSLNEIDWKIVGQFHDEIVVDWNPVPDRPAWKDLNRVLVAMRGAMTEVAPEFRGFPLDADIKHDYRYTK